MLFENSHACLNARIHNFDISSCSAPVHGTTAGPIAGPEYGDCAASDCELLYYTRVTEGSRRLLLGP
jgi:hypothetical protein